MYDGAATLSGISAVETLYVYGGTATLDGGVDVGSGWVTDDPYSEAGAGVLVLGADAAFEGFIMDAGEVRQDAYADMTVTESFSWTNGDINVAGNYNLRQGYPFPQAVQTPSRANRAGTANVLLDTMGDVRLDNVYTLDLRVDKAFTFGTVRFTPSMDIFNVTNVNTVLARRRLQGASNANNISGIVAPRVIRFGIRVNW